MGDFDVIWMNDFDYAYGKSMYPSALNIKAMIKRTVAAQKPGDVLWFHYSGHGTQIPNDDDSADTNDGSKDESMVSADYSNPASPVRGTEEVFIRDDWLKEHFADPLEKKGIEAFVMFDCCHSGSMFDLEYRWDNKTNQWRIIPHEEDGPGKVVFLSGAQDDQEAKEPLGTILTILVERLCGEGH